MRAVGEVMSIGKTYKEAFQKAIRSLETGRFGLGFAKDFATLSKDELLRRLHTPSSERHFMMYEALRKGATVEEIYNITKVKHWFIEQMAELVAEEEALIDRVREAYLSRTKVGCTGCKYCVPCPNEVDIPGIFAVWNDRSLYNQELKGNGGYKRRIDEGHSADRCIECGACEGVCPQKIDIIAKLKQADAEMR